MKKILLIGCSFIALVSCTSTPIDGNSSALPQLTYEHLSKVPLNVKNINFVSKTQRGARAWDIANSLPTPPDIAMRRYISQRFSANGTDGTVEITLVKADIIKDEIPNRNKVLSYIPLANEENYSFEVILNLQNMYQSGQPNRSSDIRFVRKFTMPLRATIAYREARLQRMMEEIIRDFDDALMITFSDEFGVLNRNNIPKKLISPNTVIPVEQQKPWIPDSLRPDYDKTYSSGKSAVGKPVPLQGMK